MTNANDGLFQPATGGAPGTPALQSRHGPARLHPAPRQHIGVAWLFDGTTFGTFDDPAAISQKVEYVREQKLGGAMAWSLDSDDANSSLMQAIADGLGRNK